MSVRPRITALLACTLPFVGAVTGQVNEPVEWKLIVSGSTKGYLSPCGCTSPMIGGIKRRATVVQQLGAESDLIIETGPFVGTLGRQMEIKAETLAQSLKVMRTDYIALQADDLIVGEGVLDSVARLSDAQLLRGTSQAFESTDKWVIGSDLGKIPLQNAIRNAKFVDEQKKGKQVSIYVTHLGRTDAEKIAKDAPGLDVIIYLSSSTPQTKENRIGKTWLVSPADQGRYVVTLQYSGDQFEAPAVFELGMDVHDHSDVNRYYSQYLDRLKSEDLVQMMPKSSTEKYSSSQACMSCHPREYKIWESSKHNMAWETLEKIGHDVDPDCVGCHTTGIESTQGFLIEEKTPELTDVGCESCHGPSAAHVMSPTEVKLPKVGPESCMSCHKLQNSPNFKFESYWEKIKH